MTAYGADDMADFEEPYEGEGAAWVESIAALRVPRGLAVGGVTGSHVRDPRMRTDDGRDPLWWEHPIRCRTQYTIDGQDGPCDCGADEKNALVSSLRDRLARDERQVAAIRADTLNEAAVDWAAETATANRIWKDGQRTEEEFEVAQRINREHSSPAVWLRARAAALGVTPAEPEQRDLADYGGANDQSADPTKTRCRRCRRTASEHSPGRFSIYGTCPAGSVAPTEPPAPTETCKCSHTMNWHTADGCYFCDVYGFMAPCGVVGSVPVDEPPAEEQR